MHETQVNLTFYKSQPYAAACLCGWLGEPRESRSAAQEDGAAHAAANSTANIPLFDLAVYLSRAAGAASEAEGEIARRLADAREQGMKEGREALAAALLSEMEAAKPDYRKIEVTIRNEEQWREPGLTGSEARTSQIAWEVFADHIRQWLAAEAPERPLLDVAWERINALGGTEDSPIVSEFGYGAALQDALRIIEQLGGKDPARKEK